MISCRSLPRQAKLWQRQNPLLQQWWALAISEIGTFERVFMHGAFRVIVSKRRRLGKVAVMGGATCVHVNEQCVGLPST